SLHISDAQDEDQGRYECIAENSVGTAISRSATLFVRAVQWEPPYFTFTPESTYVVSPGETLNLTCVAEGSPMPYVRWRKGLVYLPSDSENLIHRNVLVLENVRESANYTCVSGSLMGIIEHVSQVLVQEGDNQTRSPSFPQVRDARADPDNHTDLLAITPARSGSVELNVAVSDSLAPAVNEVHHLPAECETTPAETALHTGRLSLPQRSFAEGADARIALLREEHALRMRLIQEDHDDILEKRNEEHNLKMEILILRKGIQDFLWKRLQKDQ
ncbi:hypothetical protein MTO96_042699, partial [Rhipicephalus appendiculatus]